MLETLMTSKVRTALMKHFLGHPQERFYLRQLERLLQLPLTPARRELIRLTKMGLLKEEQEANLRFFRLNEGFEHLEELGRLVGIEKAVEGGRWKVEGESEAAVGIGDSPQKTGTVPNSWLAPVFGLIALLMVLQVSLFYIWTHPVEKVPAFFSSATDLDEKEAGSFSFAEKIEEKTERLGRHGQTALATDSYVMSSGKARLESGGFGGWQ